MPGSPQKRARRAEAEAKKLREVAGGEPPLDVPDALPTTTVRRNKVSVPDARDARAFTRGPARARSAAMPRAAMSPGPSFRSTVDHMQAEEIRKLSEALRPGFLLVIERTRPAWCSGWIENYELQDSNIWEVREYIKEEHGGSGYRVLVASPDGQPYYEGSLKIAGPPREDGRIIDRAKWEGRNEPAAPAPARSNGNGSDTGGLLGALAGMFQAVLEANNRTADKTLEAVRTLNEEQQRTTGELIKTIVHAREQSNERQSFTAQLREVAAANEALKDVKDALREPVPAAGPQGDDSFFNETMKAAGAQFLSNVMQSKMAGKQQQKPPAGRQRRVRLDVPPAISEPGFSGPKHGAGKAKN